MKDNNAAGAKAAAEYFWDTVYYLELTGETGPISDISADGCDGCRNVMENFPSIYEAGNWIVAHPRTLDSTAVRRLDPTEGYWLATQVMSTKEMRLFKGANDEVRESFVPPKAHRDFMIGLRYNDQDDHWNVIDAGHPSREGP